MSLAMLEKELETFATEKTRLIAEANGQFALIHDGIVAGTYNDERDAVTAGYKQFGNVPFLVKQVSEVEIPANFVNNNVGI